MQNTTMMNFFRNSILILLALTFTQVILAQKVLTGKVVDINKEPLMGTNVYVVNPNNRSLAGSMVGTNGDFVLLCLMRTIFALWSLLLDIKHR
jgi:hypothetical protein